MKSLIKEIEDKFDEIEEANVTGNLDGGAGPPKTPYAFSKSKDEDDLDDDHIEVLGYKKSKEKKTNTKKLESLERKLENKINEISYKEYKKDDSRKQHQKINDSIKQIDSKLKMIALTATATPKVQDDIIKNLSMSNASVFKSSFMAISNASMKGFSSAVFSASSSFNSKVV